MLDGSPSFIACCCRLRSRLGYEIRFWIEWYGYTVRASLDGPYPDVDICYQYG